jgi:cytochrome oxidase Cu insertion factor (SCO1/SenC/PrrC family)
MTRMFRRHLIVLLLLGIGNAVAATEPLTEDRFRANMGFAPGAPLTYRNLDCAIVPFDAFAKQMEQDGAHADLDRAPDGNGVTFTVRLRGRPRCPAPYPPITHLPEFDLRDLSGRRVSSASLRGKPTLINFYFAACVPCIREVGPLNDFAATRPGVNFLAVTFDDRETARRFVDRYGFRWRVVADARELVDRIRVKNYPMVALFDAQGRLLGTKTGGAKDELEAANVGPQLARWMDGLLRQSTQGTRAR